jgi:pilus biogenesis lipoprotein CpaD
MTSKPHRGYRLLALAGAGLAVTLGLGACTVQDRPDHQFAGAEYRADPSAVQQNLFFQPNSAHLARGESARVNAVLKSLVLRPSDDILLFLGSTGFETLDRQREAAAIKAVSGTPARIRLMTRTGFPLAAPDNDVALVQVNRYSQVRVICPSMGRDFNDSQFFRDALTMGCTNGVNIANMSAEGRDLTDPRRLDGSDGIAAVQAVERYRAGRVRDGGPLSVVTGGN